MKIERALEIALGEDKSCGRDVFVPFVKEIYKGFGEDARKYVDSVSKIAKDEIQKIEDEYKTRICGNCEYYFLHMSNAKVMQCKNHNSIMHQRTVCSDFGCNDFKRRK